MINTHIRNFLYFAKSFAFDKTNKQYINIRSEPRSDILSNEVADKSKKIHNYILLLNTFNLGELQFGKSQ